MSKYMLKGIALVYFSAFLSLYAQIVPLSTMIGHKISPSIFILFSSGFALKAGCIVGCLLSLLSFRKSCRVICLGLCWGLYLSYVNVGYPFLSFQWDVLLLEVGFLALFFNPHKPSVGMIWVFRLLVFKVMILSGWVKLASGDLMWRELTALNVHYFTQPLPHILGWYAHQLPEWIQKTSVFLMFVIELFLPFLMFIGPRCRKAVFVGVTALMVMIICTGNYTFFNCLMIVISLSLLENEAKEKQWWPVVIIALVYIACIVFPNSLHIANKYGLFAVMTTERREIDIQGSYDGKNWQSYSFRYKPGDLKRAPQWAQPHQPRLDWQLWFASLGTIQHNRWLQAFIIQLLKGNTETVKLVENNPFGSKPPTYIRAKFYDYKFTSFKERNETGQWWKRKELKDYLPAIYLNRP